MIEDLCGNLKATWMFASFFFAWPLFAIVPIIVWGQSSDRGHFRKKEALYYSLSTFTGLDASESNPTRFKWPKLIHHIVGVLAWAYITAIFITTIT